MTLFIFGYEDFKVAVIYFYFEFFPHFEEKNFFFQNLFFDKSLWKFCPHDLILNSFNYIIKNL